MHRSIPTPFAASILVAMLGLGGCGRDGEPETAAEEDRGATTEAVEAVEAGNAKGTVRLGDLELSPVEQYRKAKVGTEEVEFVFSAVNLGSAPVRITEVDSGCACIEESVDPEVVPPGGGAQIRAVYATEKVSGLVEKVIAIGTDQSGAKKAFLTVKLEMDPVYVIDRDLTTWKKGEKPLPKVVHFEVKRDRPIHILEAKPMRKEISVEVKEIEKGRKYEIHITPESTESNLLGMVRLETDCEIEAHSRPLLFVTVK